MNSNRLIRAIVSLQVLWSVLLCGQFTLTAQARPVGKVRQVRPIVEFRAGPSGRWNKAIDRSNMEPGHYIRSGATGSAVLRFTNSTQVVLNSNTQVFIEGDDTPAKPLALRVFGALSQIVVRSKGPMQIRAAAAIAAPRGTEYMVTLTNDETMVLTVAEGSVRFYNAQGEQTVNANQQSTARIGQAPTPPVAVDASGLMQWAFDVGGLPVEFEMPLNVQGDVAALRTTANANPNDAAAQMALGEVLRRSGDANGAVAAYQRAVQLDPRDTARVGLAVALLARNDVAGAGNALAANPDTALELAARGLVQLRANDVNSAVQSLTAAGQRDPQLPQAPALLALAHLTQNKTSEAISDARRAVQLAPNSSQAQSALALSLFYAGQTREASRAATRAVALNPDSPLALLVQGQALLAQHQTDAARTVLQQAESLAPNLPLIQTNLAAAYNRLDMPQRAEKAYRRVLEKSPDSATARAGLGAVLLATGQRPEALAELQRAMALEPDNVLARANLALYNIEMGNFVAAQQAAATLGEDPASGLLYIRLSEASLFQQKLFEAQEFARKAVKLLPDSAPAHYQLGRVYQEQERTVQAEQEFRQAVILEPQFTAARFALGLAREVAETGSDLNQPLSAIASNSSGPRQALNIQNLQTPGTEDRIQSAIQDPAVVRSASRAFGDTQIEGRIGEADSKDVSLSHLQEINNRRGSFGVTATRDHTDGVRANADLTQDKVGFTVGTKRQNNPSGFFVLGQLQQRTFGANTAPDPTITLGADSRRYSISLPTALIGYNLQNRENQHTRFLLQADKPKSRLSDIFGFQNIDASSFHAEFRHDWKLNSQNDLIFGAGWGKRNFNSDILSLAPPPPPGFPPDPDFVFKGGNRIKQAQVYLRGESRLNSALSLAAEVKVIQLSQNQFTQVIAPPGIPSPPAQQNKITTGLPKLTAQWKLTKQDFMQFRARSLLGAIEDFQLLAPIDTFLFSFGETPQLDTRSRGRSLEAEYTHVFPNASFLRLGAYDQQLDNADSRLEPLSNIRFRMLKARYEGIINPSTTFFVSADLADTGGQLDLTPFGPLLTNYQVSLQPKVAGQLGIQYLSPKGWFIQPSAAFIGSRQLPVDFAGVRARTGSFNLINLRLGKRQGLRSSVFVEISNLFDKTYVQPGLHAFGDLQSGRQLRVGASGRF